MTAAAPQEDDVSNPVAPLSGPGRSTPRGRPRWPLRAANEEPFELATPEPPPALPREVEPELDDDDAEEPSFGHPDEDEAGRRLDLSV